jgi:peptidoglycan/LPS O-acetylase OafA/YrhL
MVKAGWARGTARVRFNAAMGGPEPIIQAGEKRSPRIESVRALAALAVVLSHVYGRTAGPGAEGFVHRLGLGAGGFGVFLFFALSGYLMFLPFVRRDYGSGGVVDLRGYALNRALRILPLYYVVLAVVLVANEGGGSFTQWWRFATFSQSYFTDTVARVDGPMWSLVIELQFYVLLPLLALVLVTISRGSAARAAILVLALAAASFVVWYQNVHRLEPAVDQRWRYSLPVTFLSFVPGMLLALARGKIEQGGGIPRLPSSTVLVLLAIPVWLLAAYRIEWIEPLCAVASMLLLAALVLPARPGRAVGALDVRPLAALGVASYSLYLWHVPVTGWIDDRLPGGFLPLLATALPVAVAVAAGSYLAVEQPFLRLRRRWGPTPDPT